MRQRRHSSFILDALMAIEANASANQRIRFMQYLGLMPVGLQVLPGFDCIRAVVERS